MRFNKLWILPAILILWVGLGCDSGAGPEGNEESLCEDQIIDEDYTGGYRAVLGFGEGVLPALRLSLGHPGEFNATLAMNGPTSAFAELLQIDSLAADFDNWPAEPSRAERLLAMRDFLAAYGNPYYQNADSNYYPPEVDADSYTAGEPLVLPPLYSPDNPDGIYNSVTFFDDESGLAVDFWLAHDLNGNGRRDPGEPVIRQLHEPFVDTNQNGDWDAGEAYDDFGVDGVDGTGDYGEGNGQFDWNPNAAAWRAANPADLAASAALDLTPGYQNSIYLDAMEEDPWGFNEQIELLADTLETRLSGAESGVDDFCIRNSLGRYAGLQGDYPVLTEPLWFPEKYFLDLLPGSNPASSIAASDAMQIGRFYQALRFLSLRMPNGTNDIYKEDSAIWQIRSFYSEVLEKEVRFGVGFPAGYFNEISAWKSYPVVYVFHDRHSTLADWSYLLADQGDLSHRKLAKQALVIVLDGSRDADGLAGYSHYVNQAATEFGGAYGDVVDELMEYVETTFRVQVAYHDRDDDED